MTRRRLATLLCLLVGTVPNLRAQDLAILSGRVRDSRGASAAGARIELRPDHGASVNTTSDSVGRFVLRATPGSYQLIVRAIGSSVESARITLASGDNPAREVQLSRVDLDAIAVAAQFGSRYFDLSEPNYFITAREKPKRTLQPGESVNQVKFRVALRYPIVSFAGRGGESGFYLGYRQDSFWHLWEESAPFFDNNYNPHVYFNFDGLDVVDSDWAPSIRVALDHQSNGRDGPESRSWNRVIAGLDLGNYHRTPIFGHIRFWRPFSVSDQNTDIVDWAGRGEVSVSLQPLVHHGYGLGALGARLTSRVGGQDLVRNTEISLFLGSRIIGRSPLARIPGSFNASLMAQYFSGSAENLLTYRSARSVWRLGIATVH